MNKERLSFYEKIVWILTVCLIVCFTVLETYTWGRYLFLVLTVLIYFFYVYKKRKILFPVEQFQKYGLFFDGYVFLSCLWAWDKTATFGKGITIFQIVILFSFIYMYYAHKNDTRMLISAIKWAGIVVAIYTIFYFGIDGIITASTSYYRIDNTFSNANNIGMICAISIFIEIFCIIYEKLSWNSIFIVPCLLALTATQSRKALIFVVVSTIALIIMKSREEKNLKKTILTLIGLIVVFVLGIKLLSTLEIFAGVNDRMAGLFGMFGRGTNVVDHSTRLREQMSALGIAWWLKYPLSGIGIGCPYLLNSQFLGERAYLHNNYVELLCGGGIFGTVLYYLGYIYIIYNLIKYRKADFRIFIISFVWIILALAMDYGMVSYYEKTQWFYMMVHFLNIRYLRRKMEKYNGM